MELSDLDHSLEDILEAKCKSALASKVILYRGSNSHINSFSSPIRNDRLPRDSSPLYAFIFDTFMTANDLPFRKSNTLSTSVDISQTREFGDNLFRIYPFDGSLYLFSRLIDDMIGVSTNLLTRYLRYIDVDDFVQARIKMITDFTNNNYDTARLVTWLQTNASDLFDNLGLVVSKNINDIIDADGEVLIYGTAYVGLIKE